VGKLLAQAFLAMTGWRPEGVRPQVASFVLIAAPHTSNWDLAYLLAHAGLDAALDGIVSVHDMQSFKPDPAVYRHFLKEAGARVEETWLVSGNPFDVIGAHMAGWRTAWVKRDPTAVFDPWDIEPDAIITDISELAGVDLL
jgi:2-haloacid dehalogenase